MGAVNQSISVVTGQEFCDHHSTLVSFQSTDTLTEPLKMFPVCAGDAQVKMSQEAPPAPSRTAHGFSFSISPSSEYPGLISFRIDWFDLLAVQGTLKSLLEPHNSKVSVLWHLLLLSRFSRVRLCVTPEMAAYFGT